MYTFKLVTYNFCWVLLIKCMRVIIGN